MNYLLCRRLRGPVFLLTFGITALLHEWDVLSFSRSWPLYLIVYGLLRLAEGAALAGSAPAPFYPAQGFAPSAGSGYQPSGAVAPTPGTGLAPLSPSSIQASGSGYTSVPEEGK